MIRGFGLMFLSLIVSYSPAMAGFEWIPAVEQDRIPLTRAQAVYDNSALASATAGVPPGMYKGELTINPFPVSNNFVPGTDPFAAEHDHVNRAMMEETGLLGSVALGGGLSTGVRAPAVRPMPIQAQDSAFAMDPYPLLSRNKGDDMTRKVESMPLAPLPSSAPVTGTGMSPMMGGEVAPLPGYDVPRAPEPRRTSADLAMKAQNAPTPVAYTPPAAPSGGFEQAVGFGKDLPLALALSQVIPAHYALSFKDGVDAGSSVSWEGGKAWNEVLRDMLTPLGLRADISGNTVIIRQG
ncbi:MAG: hypothetical protein J0L77_00970 [Alphaproteobacteria bacterium]|nr:hypothetical protein [Alphaproteobacteria bacterium]